MESGPTKSRSKTVIWQYSSISCLRLLLPYAPLTSPRHPPTGRALDDHAPRVARPSAVPRIAAPVRDKIHATYQAGGVSLRQLARQFGVGRETVRRILCGGAETP